MNMKSILNPVLKVAREKKKATPSQKVTLVRKKMVKKKRKKFTLSGTAPNREIGWIFGSRSIKIWKKTDLLDTNQILI